MTDCTSDISNDRHENPEAANEYVSRSISPDSSSNMNSDSNASKSVTGVTPMDCETPKGNSNQTNQHTEDEDDPVVHEIPVFLAKSLSKQLFLYQV